MNNVDSFVTADGHRWKLAQVLPYDDINTLLWHPVLHISPNYMILTTAPTENPEELGKSILEFFAAKFGGDFGGPYGVTLTIPGEEGSFWLGTDESDVAHISMSTDLATWVDDRKLGGAQEFMSVREAVIAVKRLLQRDVENREYVEYTVNDHKGNPVRVLQSGKVMPWRGTFNRNIQPKLYGYDDDGILQELT